MQYKYAFDLKPPGVHYVFALAESIFGQSMFSMRVFDMLWQSFTGLIIFLITYKVSKSKVAGFVSSAMYIFLYYRYDYWHTLQADGFLNLSLSITILLLLAEDIRESFFKIFLSGLLFSFTIIFKYTLIIFLPFVFIFFLFFNKNSFTKNIKLIAYFLFGFVLFQVIIFGLYYLTGALKQFIDIQFVQIPLYANIGFETVSMDFILSNIYRLFLGSVYSPLIFLSLLLFLFLIIRRTLTGDILILVSWFLCTIFNLIVQWKFFYYHFLVIIPPLAVCAVVAVNLLSRNLFRKNNRVLAYTIVIIFSTLYFILAFKPYYQNYQNLYSYLNNVSTLEDLYIKNGITSDSAFMIGNTFQAVDYVKANTKESDYIYVWGFDPLVYYLSDRKCASRFIYNYPIYWKENNVSYRQEFINELKLNNPRLILVSSRDPLYYLSGYHEDSKQILDRFPDIKSYLESKYTYTAQIESFTIYHLNKDKSN